MFTGYVGSCYDLQPARDNARDIKRMTRLYHALSDTNKAIVHTRDAATLLRDVSEFMTLQPGDVLMLGTDCLPDGTRLRAKAGDRIEISAPDFAPLVNTLVEDAA